MPGLKQSLSGLENLSHLDLKSHVQDILKVILLFNETEKEEKKCQKYVFKGISNDSFGYQLGKVSKSFIYQ